VSNYHQPDLFTSPFLDMLRLYKHLLSLKSIRLGPNPVEQFRNAMSHRIVQNVKTLEESDRVLQAALYKVRYSVVGN